MQVRWEARPGAWRQGSGQNSAAVTSNRAQYSGDSEPAVLEIVKDGRLIRPYKLVPLNGEVVLAQAVRNQPGTEKCVSVPIMVLGFAEGSGVRWFYWRHDRLMAMRRIRLADVRKRGQLRKNGEIYVPLDLMETVDWETWAYATRVIRLGATGPTPKDQQLLLFEVA